MEYGEFNPTRPSADVEAQRKASIIAMTQNVTGEIRNPLAGMTKGELMTDVEAFAQRNDMHEQLDLLRKGALIAQNPTDFENIAELNDDDRDALRIEVTRRWKHPLQL